MNCTTDEHDNSLRESELDEDVLNDSDEWLDKWRIDYWPIFNEISNRYFEVKFKVKFTQEGKDHCQGKNCSTSLNSCLKPVCVCVAAHSKPYNLLFPNKATTKKPTFNKKNLGFFVVVFCREINIHYCPVWLLMDTLKKDH